MTTTAQLDPEILDVQERTTKNDTSFGLTRRFGVTSMLYENGTYKHQAFTEWDSNTAVTRRYGIAADASAKAYMAVGRLAEKAEISFKEWISSPVGIARIAEWPAKLARWNATEIPPLTPLARVQLNSAELKHFLRDKTPIEVREKAMKHLAENRRVLGITAIRDWLKLVADTGGFLTEVIEFLVEEANRRNLPSWPDRGGLTFEEAAKKQRLDAIANV